MILFLILILIVFACAAMLWNEGLWSNTLTLINVLLAAMLATNYYEAGARVLESMIPSYTYFCDFLAIWGLFFVFFSILRAVTDIISKVRVRFRMPVEMAGRVIVALWIAWIMIGFSTFSLHLAPLARSPFRGVFASSPEKTVSFFWLSPDKHWIAFVQSRSRGALSRGGGAPAESNFKEQDGNRRVFDPNSDLVLKYAQRRADLEKYVKETGSLRVQK